MANTISNKVEWLSNYYTLYLPAFVAAAMNVLLYLPLLFRFDAVSALICVASVIGLLSCPMLFYPVMKERGEKEWTAHTAYYADFLDSIQGIAALKAFNANKRRREYIQRCGEELRRAVMGQLRITMLETGVMELFIRLGTALCVAVTLIRATDGLISPDAPLYMLFLSGACFSPLLTFRNAWHMGYRGVTASLTIQELLDQKTVLAMPTAQAPVISVPFNGGVSFEDVRFAYKDDEGDVLHDVSFTIPRGTTIALVGASGGGKSTVAHLLAGFYPVREGAIYVNGMKLNAETVGVVQSWIAAVWQDSHIFYDTVYENIRFGRSDATRKEIIEAAKKANLHEMIEALPEGYNTLLGENGMRFSGGERQRVALARAFLKNAPILIFDEATSSLDRKNEIEIQRSFDELRRGRTVLVIAHRLSTIQNAEQICVIENGRITAFGAHDELAETSLVYRKLLDSSTGMRSAV
jgi:ATP-binding cassette subfamily B protein